MVGCRKSLQTFGVGSPSFPFSFFDRKSQKTKNWDVLFTKTPTFWLLFDFFGTKKKQEQTLDLLEKSVDFFYIEPCHFRSRYLSFERVIDFTVVLCLCNQKNKQKQSGQNQRKTKNTKNTKTRDLRRGSKMTKTKKKVEFGQVRARSRVFCRSLLCVIWWFFGDKSKANTVKMTCELKKHKTWDPRCGSECAISKSISMILIRLIFDIEGRASQVQYWHFFKRV